MGLLILKIWLWLRSFFHPRIRELGTPLSHRFFVWPLDLDENLHMNNSRYLNYMELARWDLNIRSGFLKYALKNGIMAPVLNTAIVYRRSLGPLQTFNVHTQLVARRGQSLFVEQTIERHGKLYAVAVIELRAVRRGSTLDVDELLNTVGLTFTPLPAGIDGFLDDSTALMKQLLQRAQQRFG